MKTFTKLTLLLVASVVLFSFALLPGGDHYEVYLDDKLVLEQSVHGQKSIPSVNVDQRAEQSILSIQYSHCGKIGTARMIRIKDGQNKVLKEWQFADAATGTKSPMTFKVKDLASLKQKNGTTLNLVYSSKEIPEGRSLASVVLTNELNTALN